jgi:hypothetical protein
VTGVPVGVCEDVHQDAEQRDVGLRPRREGP